MSKVKAWFGGVFYIVMIVWWRLWSNAYRFFYQRKYKKVELSKDLSSAAATTLMRRLTWTKDGPKELWDAVSRPGWVQHVINVVTEGGEQPEGSLDCDDYATWAAHTLRKDYNAKILTFAWIDTRGRSYGHAVCLCNHGTTNMFHVGNWGKLTGFRSLRDVCEDMMRRTDAELPIAWSLLDKNLKVECWGRGLPKDTTPTQ